MSTIHLPHVRPTPKDLVVDRHDLDVEGDVLLRLPSDLLFELVVRHHRDGDLADDDRLAVHANRHVLLRDLVVVKDLEQRFDDRARVHHVSVDDRLRRQGSEPVPDDLELLARFLELHDLDRARADVDSD